MSREWHKTNRKRRIFERRFFTRFKRALNSQIDDLLNAIIKMQDFNNLEQYAEALIIDESIQKVFEDLYADVGVSFMKKTVREVKKTRKVLLNTKDLTEDLWAEEMRAYSVSVTGSRIVSINSTTKKEAVKLIRQIITEQTEAGKGIDEIARTLDKQVPKKWRKINKFRAQRIAQTEVLTASNTAAHEAAKRSGIPLVKVWLTAPVGVARERERHAVIPGLHGQERFMSMPFSVDGAPMQHPGDPAGGARNVINCHCGLTHKPIEII